MVSSNLDETVQSPNSVMPDLIRHPEASEKTGFRVKPGMTNLDVFDFLRKHQTLN